MNKNKAYEIYLDHAASSLIHPKVTDHLFSLYQMQLGNSASIHRSGVQANRVLETARIQLASQIGCSPEEITFTSGATESNNLVFFGLKDLASERKRYEILISSIEHSSIAKLTSHLEDRGFTVKIVPVDRAGKLNLSILREMISDKTLLLSVIHANNEIGTIQDLRSIADICKTHGTLFHSDGAQAFCKTDLHFEKMGLDFYSLSAHKIHGPRGVGAVVIRKGLPLIPQLIGGGQENGLRSGTVAVELISAMAFATSLFSKDHLEDMRKMQMQLVQKLKELCPQLRVNGCMEHRLPSNLNLAFPGVQGKFLLQKLDHKGIRLSVGSACNATKKTPSNVLLSLGQKDSEVLEAIRISFGLQTTQTEIDQFVSAIKEILAIP